MKTTATLLAALALAASLTACDAGEEEGDCLTDDPSASAEAALADGVRVDPFCGPLGVKLYDRFDRTGQVLCLIGKGSVRLSTFPRLACTSLAPCTIGDWHDGVRSLAAGATSGFLSADGVGRVRAWLPTMIIDRLSLDAMAADAITLE